MPRSSK
jgi:hypothetical protein